MKWEKDGGTIELRFSVANQDCVEGTARMTAELITQSFFFQLTGFLNLPLLAAAKGVEKLGVVLASASLPLTSQQRAPPHAVVLAQEHSTLLASEGIEMLFSSPPAANATLQQMIAISVLALFTHLVLVLRLPGPLALSETMKTVDALRTVTADVASELLSDIANDLNAATLTPSSSAIN